MSKEIYYSVAFDSVLFPWKLPCLELGKANISGFPKVLGKWIKLGKISSICSFIFHSFQRHLECRAEPCLAPVPCVVLRLIPSASPSSPSHCAVPLNHAGHAHFWVRTFVQGCTSSGVSSPVHTTPALPVLNTSCRLSRTNSNSSFRFQIEWTDEVTSECVGASLCHACRTSNCWGPSVCPTRP